MDQEFKQLLKDVLPCYVVCSVILGWVLYNFFSMNPTLETIIMVVVMPTAMIALFFVGMFTRLGDWMVQK